MDLTDLTDLTSVVPNYACNSAQHTRFLNDSEELTSRALKTT